MSKDRPRNLPASVRERLHKLAAARKEDFQLVLTRYGLERLLYRLSRSPHADSFILKGAMLFQLWAGQPHRPTRDLDLLGRGDNSIAAVVGAFREVCNQAVEEDGLDLRGKCPRRTHQGRPGIRGDSRPLRGPPGERPHPAADRRGLRGRGDAASCRRAVSDAAGVPRPGLRAYRRETVVAEKFQAMTALGMANSRMKDFYDLWVLARGFAFDGPTLSGAIRQRSAGVERPCRRRCPWL